MDGGRTRIRTRVFGLEGQSDIQTTLYVLVQCGGSLFKKVTIDYSGRAHFTHRRGLRTVRRFHSKPQWPQVHDWTVWLPSTASRIL